MEPYNLKNKVVIAGALDWGLGHLTRLKTLMKKTEVAQWIILTTSEQKNAYQKDFPHAIIYETESLNWQWTGTKSAAREMFRQRKKWNRHFQSVQKLIEEIHRKHNANFILSDNRYGMYHKDIPSILLSHQLNLPTSFWVHFLAQKKLDRYLSLFQQIWVPDYADPQMKLSGKLSNSTKKFQSKTHFIDPICRFNWGKTSGNPTENALLLSGPEPQRKNFLLDVLASYSEDKTLTIITPETYSDIQLCEKHHWLENPEEETLKNTLENSKTIISRAGYSTIMEIHALKNKQKIIVPTPFQNEQKYLGEHLNGKWGFTTCNQKNLRFNSVQ